MDNTDLIISHFNATRNSNHQIRLIKTWTKKKKVDSQYHKSLMYLLFGQQSLRINGGVIVWSRIEKQEINLKGATLVFD